jgi:hypothetical protein
MGVINRAPTERFNYTDLLIVAYGVQNIPLWRITQARSTDFATMVARTEEIYEMSSISSDYAVSDDRLFL